MTAASRGIVDESGFEVRLMGGLSVLKDGRDPLYTMQAAVNGVSVIALAWAFVALLEAWRIGDIGWFGLASSGIITLTVGLFISLELILSHDLVLLRSCRSLHDCSNCSLLHGFGRFSRGRHGGRSI